jgi:hypothetical protein
VPCPHCGRPLSQPVELVDRSSADGFDQLGRAQLIELDHVGGAGFERADESVVRRGPLLSPAFLATFGIFIVVVVAAAAAIGSGSPPSSDRSQDSIEEGGDSQNGGASTGSGVGQAQDNLASIGGDPDFPPSDEHLAADAIASTFRSQVDFDGGYTIYYTTETGVKSVSAAGISEPEVTVANTLNQVMGFPLLSDGNRTWAIDGENPDTVFLVSTQFVVVDSDLSSSVAFIDPSGDTLEVGVSSYGGWRPGIRIPDNSDVLAVSGRGLLIAPPTGGTYLVSGTGQLESLSDDRVVAAGIGSEVFRRCDDQLQCELYARLSNADGLRSDRDYPLDVGVEERIIISPLGRFVATISDGIGPVGLITTRTGERFDLGDHAVVASGWAPDSSFLALATVDELMIVSTATGEAVTVPLPAMPSAPSLLVDRR